MFKFSLTYLLDRCPCHDSSQHIAMRITGQADLTCWIDVCTTCPNRCQRYLRKCSQLPKMAHLYGCTPCPAPSGSSTIRLGWSQAAQSVNTQRKTCKAAAASRCWTGVAITMCLYTSFPCHHLSSISGRHLAESDEDCMQPKTFLQVGAWVYFQAGCVTFQIGLITCNKFGASPTIAHKKAVWMMYTGAMSVELPVNSGGQLRNKQSMAQHGLMHAP